MFVDSVELTISSGKGGPGCISFWTEKFVAKGGPDGGDGGRGGSVFFEVDNNTDTLSAFRGKRVIKAENGRPGEGRKCSGRKGKDTTIIVPPGTQIVDMHTGNVLMDLLNEGDVVKFLDGGKGGLGNTHFKNSTNQRPTYAQPGLPGESREVMMEMKLIADVGLVGFPNVGKSTLISTLSNARPKVANYEFTTLIPNIGIVGVGDFDSFAMADIPGIIEGASDGRGLGLEFLKHIERTKTLLLLIDATNYREMKYQYEILKDELKNYSEELSQRPHAVAITKIDALSTDEVNEKTSQFLEDISLKANKALNKYGDLGAMTSYGQVKEEWEETVVGEPAFVVPISSVAQMHTEVLRYALSDLVKEQRKIAKAQEE